MKILENERVRDLLVAIHARTVQAKKAGDPIVGMSNEIFDTLRPRGVTTTDLVRSGLVTFRHDQRPEAGGRTVVILTDTGQMVTDVIRAERRRCDDLRDFDAECVAADAL